MNAKLGDRIYDITQDILVKIAEMFEVEIHNITNVLEAKRNKEISFHLIT